MKKYLTIKLNKIADSLIKNTINNRSKLVEGIARSSLGIPLS